MRKNMKTMIITNNDSGQRLDKFLSKSLKAMPESLLYKYIRKKRIKVNGKKGEVSTRLQEGDVLSLYINDEFFQECEEAYDFLKAPKKLNILYEDDNLLLLDKQPGLIVHPDETYHFDSLIARVKHYLYEKGCFDPAKEQSFTPSLVNRIDRNTGGIVIAAKNAETLRILNDKMRNRELKKRYLCIVHGLFTQKSGTLTAYLEKNESQHRVYISKKPTKKTKTIQTRYQVLDEKDRFSLVEVELLTGRTHQIRAHMAYLGHPLVGDGKYGTNALNKPTGYKYQALYSYKLTFSFTSPSGSLEYLNGREFTAPNVWFLKDFYRSPK